MAHQTLSEEELNTLGYYLEKEAQQRDALDFFATHGLMTALSINPQPNDLNTLWALIFEETPKFDNAEQEHIIKALLVKLWREIDSLLSEAEAFPVPCELAVEVEGDEELAPLESWAQGFMEGLMHQQDDWFKNKEAEIAEHLLPLHYASGLFSDEPEMQEIDHNPELSKQVCEALPTAVTDLYLAFRV